MTGSDGAPRERSVAEIRSERFLLFGLATSGVASEALYLRLVRFNAIDGLRPVVTFVGFMMVLFAIYGLAFLLLRKIQLRAKAALAITALGAVIFRITMIPAGLPPDASIAEMRQLVREDLHGTSVGFDRFLLYDDDIWRYLWDGHVWADSVNPFRFAPTDARLNYLAGSASSSGSDEASPWQDIRDNINHTQVPTIYPPLAQLFFRLSHVLAPGSVIVLKTILVSFDLLTMLLVYLVLRKLGSHPAWLLLYAWNPLLIKVVAGSGHIDVLAATLLALTAYLLQKRAHLPAALALAGAALVKVAPLALLPFLAKRIGWKKSLATPMVVLLAYVPFRGAGWSVFTGLARYAQGWQFNSAFFLVIQSLARPFAKDPAMVARAIGMSAFSATAIWFWWHDHGEPSSFSHFGARFLR